MVASLSRTARTAVTRVRLPPDKLWIETRAGAGGSCSAVAVAFEAEFRYVVQSDVAGRVGAAATGGFAAATGTGSGFTAGVAVVPVTAADA